MKNVLRYVATVLVMGLGVALHVLFADPFELTPDQQTVVEQTRPTKQQFSEKYLIQLANFRWMLDNGEFKKVKKFLLENFNNQEYLALNWALIDDVSHPLHYVVKEQGEKGLPMINTLIRLGARVDVQDVDGRTPVHYVVMHADTDLVTKFLRVKDNPYQDCRDIDELSPLDYAIIGLAATYPGAAKGIATGVEEKDNFSFAMIIKELLDRKFMFNPAHAQVRSALAKIAQVDKECYDWFILNCPKQKAALAQIRESKTTGGK